MVEEKRKGKERKNGKRKTPAFRKISLRTPSQSGITDFRRETPRRVVLASSWQQTRAFLFPSRRDSPSSISDDLSHCLSPIPGPILPPLPTMRPQLLRAAARSRPVANAAYTRAFSTTARRPAEVELTIGESTVPLCSRLVER